MFGYLFQHGPHLALWWYLQLTVKLLSVNLHMKHTFITTHSSDDKCPYQNIKSKGTSLIFTLPSDHSPCGYWCICHLCAVNRIVFPRLCPALPLSACMVGFKVPNQIQGWSSCVIWAATVHQSAHSVSSWWECSFHAVMNYNGEVVLASCSTVGKCSSCFLCLFGPIWL